EEVMAAAPSDRPVAARNRRRVIEMGVSFWFVVIWFERGRYKNKEGIRKSTVRQGRCFVALSTNNE
ncbi:MAG: hypothetical protein ACRER2_13755, partial [Methylococcales bacterium]